jgi:hypothetical protein
MNPRLLFEYRDSLVNTKSVSTGTQGFYLRHLHKYLKVFHFDEENKKQGIINNLHRYLKILDSQISHFFNQYFHVFNMADGLSPATPTPGAYHAEHKALEFHHEINQSTMSELGLIKAVKNEILRLCNTKDITSHIYIDNPDLRFNKHFEATLYQVTLQALISITKHTTASEIAFTFGTSDSRELILQIWNNGTAMPIHDPLPLEMTLVHRYTESIGGQVDIVPFTKNGMLIVISIPEETWKSQIHHPDAA